MQPPSAPPTRRTENSASGSDELPLSSRRLGPALDFGCGERMRIRVALAFFALAAAPGIAGGAPRMVLCAAIVFSAALIHELGHALYALLSGSRATVVLHVLGSHTVIEPRLSRGRELVSTLVGPLVSIALGLLLFRLHRAFPAHSWLTISSWVNLGWGALNLLPVLPFDGGRAVLALVGDKQRSSALLISGMCALVIAIQGLAVLRSAPTIFLFGAAAIVSLLGWAQQRRVEAEQALGLPGQLETARRLLADGEYERARQLATRIGVRACSNNTANAAWEQVAWAELGLGLADRAYCTLSRTRPASDVNGYCLAAVQAARGEIRHAIGLLERALGRDVERNATKLLIDLHARLGAFEQACRVASAGLSALDPDETRRVIEAAFEAEAFGPATELAGELAAITGSPDDAVSHAYGLARLGDRTTAKRIFSQLVSLLSNWQMHKETLARLLDLLARPDLCELIGPELSHRALAAVSPLG
ncbi:MAG TPA: hypothetical protein VK745_27390 [Polyangiaceae bacterium]|nr:hypothetical protein [Polyangiaceae bacterium]